VPADRAAPATRASLPHFRKLAVTCRNCARQGLRVGRFSAAYRKSAAIPGFRHRLSRAMQLRSGHPLQVQVRDNNVDQALRVLKKRLQREGVFREMKRRKYFEKPSEVRVREKAEAIRRRRKAERKQAIRDGLITDPKAASRQEGRTGPGGGGPGARPSAAPGFGQR